MALAAIGKLRLDGVRPAVPMFTAMWAAATGSFREIAMDWELPEGEISSSPFSSSSEDKDTLRVGRAPTTFAARSAASPSTGSKGTSKKNTVTIWSPSMTSFRPMIPSIFLVRVRQMGRPKPVPDDVVWSWLLP